MARKPEIRLVGYARVSTEDQSLDLQVNALRAAGVLADNMHVEKRSGSRAKDRPELWNAIKDCREGDTLVVWRVDRLSRSLVDAHAIIAELQNRGAGFRSLTEHIDLATPAGRLAWRMMMSFAEFEKDSIAERTKAGLAAIREKRGKGWKWGRKPLLTPSKIERAGRMLNKGMSGPDVAKHFGVSTPTIYQHWKYAGSGKFVRKTPKK